MRDQKTDDDNAGNPVFRSGGASPSPTHGQSPAFRGNGKDADNNVHQDVLPLEPHVHHSE